MSGAETPALPAAELYSEMTEISKPQRESNPYHSLCRRGAATRDELRPWRGPTLPAQPCQPPASRRAPRRRLLLRSRALERNRTSDPRIRNPVLSPLSYEGNLLLMSTWQPMHSGLLHFARCSPSTISWPSCGSEVHQLQYAHHPSSRSWGWKDVIPQRGQVIDGGANLMKGSTSVQVEGFEPPGLLLYRQRQTPGQYLRGDRRDSNPRPPGPQPGARPAELRPQCPGTVSNRRPPRCERGALPLSYPD